MILGVGTDIVQISRIEDLIEKFDSRFKQYFTSEELESSKRYSNDNKKQIASHFAKRFAAKEAFVKALGTGVAGGIRFNDIGVVNDENGKPNLKITGKAKEVLERLAPKDHEIRTFISLSDDYPLAQAMVVLSYV